MKDGTLVDIFYNIVSEILMALKQYNINFKSHKFEEKPILLQPNILTFEHSSVIKTLIFSRLKAQIFIFMFAIPKMRRFFFLP